MPICIAGMHRSGTSMTTQLLHEAGLYLGLAADLPAPGPANPEGHWENRRFVRLNGRILKQLGGDWDYPPPAPERWTDDALASLRQEATTLAHDFERREPWGWKDPRNCLTLPLWQGLLDRVQVVIVVRNPLEVAESLRKRNGFSYALSLALWHTYNQRVRDAVTPRDRIITHYGSYFRDPARELQRMLTLLDLPRDDAIIARASAARVVDLRHHQLTMADLDRAGVAPEMQALYRELCQEADWTDAVASTTSAADSRTWEEPDPSEFTGRPTKPTKPQGGRRQQLQAAQTRIAELEQTVLELQRALATHQTESGNDPRSPCT